MSEDKPDALPPQSREAEDAVCGAVLLWPDCISDLLFLKPDHFYWYAPRCVWEAMLAIHDRHEDVDSLTVIAELRQRKKLDEIGGTSVLTQLVNDTPSHQNAETYARLVERAAIRRRGVAAAEKIANLFYFANKPLEELLDETEQEILSVRGTHKSDDVLSMRELASQIYDEVEHRYLNQGVPAGLSTGFLSLDQMLGGGFMPGDLVVIAARPGFGKTTLMLNIARNNAIKDRAVAVFSLEMSAKQLTYRLAAAETSINAQKFRQGNLDEHEWTIFTREVSHIAGLPIYLDAGGRASVRQMVAKCRRMARQYRLSLIVVDYLQLMVSDSDKRMDNRTLEIGDITRNLKLLAGELGVPIIIASQLNRAVESRADKRPQLSDLRQSGDIEQDADTVMFIYRDEMYNDNTADPGIAEILISKQRNGPTGMVKLGFSGSVTRFSETRHVDLRNL